MALQPGEMAPDFRLPSTEGGELSLGDLKGKKVVLYFYPKDSTPGCTREAQAFSAARKAIEKAGGAVLGVSRDSVKSHCSFRDKYGLSIPLASDPELSAHEAYGAWGEKVMYGRKVLGCIRSTFLVRDGRVVRVFPSVKVDGHADAVLAALGGTAGSAAAPTKKPAAKKVAPTKKLAAKKIAPKKKLAPKKRA